MPEWHAVATMTRQGERLGQTPALQARRWQVSAQDACEARHPKRDQVKRGVGQVIVCFRGCRLRIAVGV